MSSYEQYSRSLRVRIAEFKKRFDNLFLQFAHGTQETRRQAASDLKSEIDLLRLLIADPDRPTCFQPIYAAITEFITQYNNRSSERLLRAILDNSARVEALDLEVGRANLDFDELFVKYRDEGRIPELFDQMIDALAKILESNSVDSTVVSDALRRLLAMLKANRKGSYLAMFASLNFGKFVMNCTSEFLKEIPFVRPIVAGLEKTIEESDKELDRVYHDWKDHNVASVMDTDSINRLKQVPERRPMLLDAPAITEQLKIAGPPEEPEVAE